MRQKGGGGEGRGRGGVFSVIHHRGTILAIGVVGRGLRIYIPEYTFASPHNPELDNIYLHGCEAAGPCRQQKHKKKKKLPKRRTKMMLETTRGLNSHPCDPHWMPHFCGARVTTVVRRATGKKKTKHQHQHQERHLLKHDLLLLEPLQLCVTLLKIKTRHKNKHKGDGTAAYKE